jgi:hypothetical protein
MPNQKIYDLLKPAAIAAYWVARAPAEEQTYWGATRFPAKYTPELSIEWISGETGLPVALNPSSFDSEPPLRQRIGFEQTKADIPFFREAFLIKEKDSMMLARVANGDVSESFLRPLIDRVYEDAYELLEAGRVQREAQRMQLLSKAGTIALEGAGARYTLEYPFPAKNKFVLTGGAAWANTATANPVEDIYRWRKAIYQQTGSWPTEIVMSPATWRLIKANETITNAIVAQRYPGAGSNFPVPAKDYEKYLVEFQDDGTAGSRQLKVRIHEEMYKPHSGSSPVPYFDDNVVALLPSGNLGSTWYTDPPESLMNVSDKYDVTMTEAGIAVCQSGADNPPLNIRTWAAMLSLPSFEAIRNCGWARVA